MYNNRTKKYGIGARLSMLAVLVLVCTLTGAYAQGQFDLPNDGKWYKIAVMSGRHGYFEYSYSSSAANQPSISSGRVQFINAKNHSTQVHQTMGYSNNNQPQFALVNMGNQGEMWVKAGGNANTGVFKIVRSEYAAMINGSASDANLNDNGGTVTYFERLPDNAHVFEGNAFVQGNVGIGTTSPNAKLAVNGNILAKEIKVEANPWPDYVFEEGYELPDLSVLSSYIKANRHLPGMPSARQVEAEGIALGEMNRLLLEKVEELTLLLIHKKKDEERMEEMLRAFEKRLNKVEEKK